MGTTEDMKEVKNIQSKKTKAIYIIIRYQNIYSQTDTSLRMWNIYRLWLMAGTFGFFQMIENDITN